jgi:hypothetical protein
MVFKTTSIKSRIKSRSRQWGLTLVETLVASGISSVVFALVASTFIFDLRSFVGLSNYSDLDQKSRSALDLMSKQIRRTIALSNCTETSLTFDDFDRTPLQFSYDPVARTLVRIKDGVTDPRPLLTECDFLQFGIFQRNHIPGTYDQYPTATAGTCKLVQLTWICSRQIAGTKFNTESVQSAKIVIRRR